jgi:hypothetical protein
VRKLVFSIKVEAKLYPLDQECAEPGAELAAIVKVGESIMYCDYLSQMLKFKCLMQNGIQGRTK